MLVGERVAAHTELSGSKRVQFMLETLRELKNNKRKMAVESLQYQNLSKLVKATRTKKGTPLRSLRPVCVLRVLCELLGTGCDFLLSLCLSFAFFLSLCFSFSFSFSLSLARFSPSPYHPTFQVPLRAHCKHHSTTCCRQRLAAAGGVWAPHGLDIHINRTYRQTSQPCVCAGCAN